MTAERGERVTRALMGGAALLAAGLLLAGCAETKLAATAAKSVIGDKDQSSGRGIYKIGEPYQIGGIWYYPAEDYSYDETGIASWYGEQFHGRYTANGEIFDKDSISAAHPTLPLPSYARVTNIANHKSIIVRVNDRGPYARGRLIDVSVRTAKLLGFYGNGTTNVKVEYVGQAPLAGSDDRKLIATLRDGAPAEAPVAVASARPFAPAYFAHRRIADIAPIPPDRPYRLGEGASEGGQVETASAESSPEQPDTAPSAAPASVFSFGSSEAAAPNLFSGRGLY